MTSFLDLGLARRLEGGEVWGSQQYVEALNRLRPAVGATTLSAGGGSAIFAGVGSPMSRAVGLGLHGPVEPAELDELEAFYRAHGAPAMVNLCPLADASLQTLLAQRGYHLAEFDSVWVRALDGPVLRPCPSAMTIAVAGPAEGDAWVQTVASGFAQDEAALPASLDITAPFFWSAGTLCFLVRIGGEPAGGGALAIHEGLAGLFTGATLPAFRRRGVQTALLQARLAFAADAGCDLATVQTEPGSTSQRNVERLGFRLAYVKPTLVRV